MDNMAENGLPEEVWALIAGFSNMEKGLSLFRLASQGLNKVGSIALLHRLRTIDKTLPLKLPQNDAAQFLKKAFENIQAQQQAEIIYLKEHHSEHIKQEACLTEHASESPLSLEILEKRHIALDNVNSKIIISKIEIPSTKLDLSFAHITRLPISLFEDEDYIVFWKNLLVLDIQTNNIAMLDVQECTSLQSLNCCFNKMIWLNVKNLRFLQELDCSANLLSMLDVQGLIALKTLKCNTNKIATLNVQGLFALAYLDCTDNILEIFLFQGCDALQTLYCRDNKLRRFNGEGLTQLQTLDCRENPLIGLNLQNLVTLQKLYFDHTSSLLYLNLTGLQPNVKKPFTEIENTLLFSFNALSISTSSSSATPEEKQLQIKNETNTENPDYKKLKI